MSSKSCRLATNWRFAAADFDTDGDVDNVDLATWQAAFDTTAAGDANGDGLTNGLDFLVWQEQFTGQLVPLGVVPEPNTGLLMMLASLVTIVTLRRKPPTTLTVSP